jgi:ribosomal protein L12E/L44/L45/RPP1/RPP2
MDTKRTTAAVNEQPEATVAEPTTQQVVNEGIARVIEATGVDVQKARYKAMRAIAFQAFANAIKDGTFDDLVAEAIVNADSLPSGWELGRTAKAAAA